MSDSTDPKDLDKQVTIQEPPPSGDPDRAEHYINQLINFMSHDKVSVSHTDLAKFDPSSLEDHYRIDLNDYQVEVSHSKQPNSGKDSYVILFTNIKNLQQENCEKVILAYMHLNEDQFRSFKAAADDQIERKRKEAEEKRLKEALAPIDILLSQVAGDTDHEDETGRDDVLTSEVAQDEVAEANSDSKEEDSITSSPHSLNS